MGQKVVVDEPWYTHSPAAKWRENCCFLKPFSCLTDYFFEFVESFLRRFISSSNHHHEKIVAFLKPFSNCCDITLFAKFSSAFYGYGAIFEKMFVDNAFLFPFTAYYYFYYYRSFACSWFVASQLQMAHNQRCAAAYSQKMFFFLEWKHQLQDLNLLP